MRISIIVLGVLASATAWAESCDMSGYKAQQGLGAIARPDGTQLTWTGERGEQLRADFAIRNGQPVVRELSAHAASGKWIVLGHDLTPEFEVTSGKRRLSEQQMQPLRELGVQLTPALIEKEKWNAFWDAPLEIPGRANTNLGLPRKQEEIRRDWATYKATGCKVTTIGARVEVSFPGVELGIFSGALQYTAYRGSNLLRQEVIASTHEDSVAYKYDSGLKGFSIQDDSRVVWRDTARAWQQYAFGGSVNQEGVALRARNRLALLETGGGSLGFMPPSHKFFFAR
ncbi:MAG TPA: hypothetical protein VNH18_08545, partial [Bryobacteraceae bacterium]|nr:hypothetical protein [Bryobacteraceae bacterium]